MFSRVTFSNGNKSMASSVSGSPAVSPALVSLSSLSVGASQYDTPVSAVPVGGCKVERLLAFIFCLSVFYSYRTGVIVIIGE